MSTAAQVVNFKDEDNTVGTESRGSLAPLLPAVSSRPAATPEVSNEQPSSEAAEESIETASKPRKRDFWKMGKKTDEEKPKSKDKIPSALHTPLRKSSAIKVAPIPALRPSSPLRPQESVHGSASPRSHPYGMPVSPGQGLYSSSPRYHSPASSQIFERDVQEDVVPSQASPQIPSHIITENHIPPALDASSEAITNAKLDPDLVEIITHATHQPASVTITGAGPEESMGSSFHDDIMHGQRRDTDNASNYATLDTTDVRRLSFISFADVVHAEHAGHAESEQRRDSAHLMSHSSHPAIAPPRSPSPMRSPVSSHGMSTSPPTSVSASVHGLEASPSRGTRPPGSPLPGQISPLGGELNIETMRQALRKTGSGDLSGFRSQPMSALGNEDGSYPERPFKE